MSTRAPLIAGSSQNSALIVLKRSFNEIHDSAIEASPEVGPAAALAWCALMHYMPLRKVARRAAIGTWFARYLRLFMGSCCQLPVRRAAMMLADVGIEPRFSALSCTFAGRRLGRWVLPSALSRSVDC